MSSQILQNEVKCFWRILLASWVCCFECDVFWCTSFIQRLWQDEVLNRNVRFRVGLSSNRDPHRRRPDWTCPIWMFPSFPTSHLMRISQEFFFSIPLRTNVRVSWNIHILKTFWLYWWRTMNHFVKEKWVTWVPNTAWVSIPAHFWSYPPTSVETVMTNFREPILEIETEWVYDFA